MSPAYRAHPEFGYLCPSPRLRRKLWMTLAASAVGVLAGAIMLSGAGEPRDDTASLGLPADTASSPPAPALGAEPTTAASSPPPASAKTACEGQTWTYVDGKCAAGRQKPRIAAIDAPAIAAIPLGRTAPGSAAVSVAKPERAGETAAVAASPRPERTEVEAVPPPKPPPATEAAAPAPAVAEPVAAASSASKERRKPARERAWREERRTSRIASADSRKPRPGTGWTKQVRGAEQFMRALFSAGISGI
jgi:hypothetical protein